MITEWDTYPCQAKFIGALGYLTQAKNSQSQQILMDLLTAVDETWFTDPDLRTLFGAFFMRAMDLGKDNCRVTLTGILKDAEKASGENGWATELFRVCNDHADYIEFDTYKSDELPAWWQKLKRPKISEELSKADQILNLPPSANGMTAAREATSKALAAFDAEPNFTLDDEDTFASLRDFVLAPRPPFSRISTGLKAIDLVLGGGISGSTSSDKGKLMIVCARPGAGKTQFALNLGMRVAAGGDSVAMWSLEMGVKQIKMRVLAAWDHAMTLRTGKPCKQLTYSMLQEHGVNGTWPDEIKERLQSETYDALETNFKVHTGGSTFTAELLCQRMRLFSRQNPSCRLFIVDHLGLLSMGGANRAIAVGDATRLIKTTATELGIDVLLLCQLNRAVEQRQEKMPQLADLRDSGRIEEDADVVVGLHRPHYYDESADPGDLRVGVLKNRQGACRDTSLRIELDCCAIYEPTYSSSF
jgi:RecA/RadA recombinase